jgi:hypothetical protein
LFNTHDIYSVWLLGDIQKCADSNNIYGAADKYGLYQVYTGVEGDQGCGQFAAMSTAYRQPQ